MSIASDLDIFVSGKGSDLCTEIAERLGIEEPTGGWDSGLVEAVEQELKDQIHNDSEALFTDYADNHGASACTHAFEANYEAPEEDEDDES